MSKLHDISDIDTSNEERHRQTTSPLAIEDAGATGFTPTETPTTLQQLVPTNLFPRESTPDKPLNLSLPNKPSITYPKLSPITKPDYEYDLATPNQLYPNLDRKDLQQLVPRKLVRDLIEFTPTQPKAENQLVSLKTPQANPASSNLPVKRKKERSKSADSPRNSDEDLELTLSERSPKSKKPTHDDTRRVLTKSYIRVVRTLAEKYAEFEEQKNSITAQQFQKLQDKLNQYKEEKTALQEKLFKAEISVSTLTKKGILLEASADAAFELAKQQTKDLIDKVQTTNEEKERLEKQQEEIQNQLKQFYEIQLDQKSKIIELHQEVFNKANTKKQETIHILEYQISSERDSHAQEISELKSHYDFELQKLQTNLQTEQSIRLLTEENFKRISYEHNLVKKRLDHCESCNNEQENYSKVLEQRLEEQKSKSVITAGELEAVKELLEEQKHRSYQAISQLQDQNNLIDQLQNHIKENENTIQQLQAKNPDALQEAYNKQITALQVERDTLASKINNLSEQYRKEINTSEAELTSTKTALNLNKRKLDQLETENKRLHEATTKLNQQVDKVN